MKKTLTKLLKYSLFAIIAAFLGFLVTYGQYVSSISGEIHTFNAHAPVAQQHSLTKKRAVERSRSSSVRILSFDVHAGMIATSSATYFEHKDEKFVLTTNHGLVGSCATIQIEADGKLYDCVEILVNDRLIDYAILKIDTIENRKPIAVPRDLVRNARGWKKTLSLLNQVVYTGYPNSIGPLTVEGSIMGFDPAGLIYVQSYAWSGSSGSGVFDNHGNLIGYIMAIDIGNTQYGTAILENVMLVVPIYKVDWSVVYKRG